MLLIPVGLIFILFYINIPVHGFNVDILPDALGYALIAVNAFQLKESSHSFFRTMQLCLFLTAYSLAVRLIQPVGILGVLLSLTELLIQLYLLNSLVCGVKELEWFVDTHLNYTVLDFWCKGLSTSWIACYVFSLVRFLFPSTAVLGKILAVIWAVLGILFIVVFFRTQHRYGLLTKNK